MWLNLLVDDCHCGNITKKKKLKKIKKLKTILQIHFGMPTKLSV
jgi:hypothetical protein